jgi:hypothetical protein
LIGNNEYNLIKQVPFTGNVRIDNTTSAQLFPNSRLNGRKFYLTDVFIAYQDEAGIATPQPRRLSIGVRIGVSGTFTAFITFPHVFAANERYMKQIQLKTPIPMYGVNPELDFIAVADTSGGGADIEVSICGWFE